MITITITIRFTMQVHDCKALKPSEQSFFIMLKWLQCTHGYGLNGRYNMNQSSNPQPTIPQIPTSLLFQIRGIRVFILSSQLSPHILKRL